MREVINSAAHYTEQLGVDLILRGTDCKKQNYTKKIRNQSNSASKERSNMQFVFVLFDVFCCFKSVVCSGRGLLCKIDFE